MDEKLRALLDNALAERFRLAYLSLKDSDDAYKDLLNKNVLLSDQIKDRADISTDAAALIQEYLMASAELSDRLQHHVYLQGAKDCVAALKEIGVIK